MCGVVSRKICNERERKKERERERERDERRRKTQNKNQILISVNHTAIQVCLIYVFHMQCQTHYAILYACECVSAVVVVQFLTVLISLSSPSVDCRLHTYRI